MKLTDFDRRIIQQGMIERDRLKALIAELSNEQMAKALGVSTSVVQGHLSGTHRNNRLSRIKAMELARQIRARNCKVTLFRIGLAWGIANTDELTDEDLQDDGLIGTYDQCVQWQDVFEAAR